MGKNKAPVPHKLEIPRSPESPEEGNNDLHIVENSLPEPTKRSFDDYYKNNSPEQADLVISEVKHTSIPNSNNEEVLNEEASSIIVHEMFTNMDFINVLSTTIATHLFKTSKKEYLASTKGLEDLNLTNTLINAIFYELKNSLNALAQSLRSN